MDIKDKTIAFYVFIDVIMIESGYKEPVNRNTSDCEIITTVLIVLSNDSRQEILAR